MKRYEIGNDDDQKTAKTLAEVKCIAASAKKKLYVELVEYNKRHPYGKICKQFFVTTC